MKDKTLTDILLICKGWYNHTFSVELRKEFPQLKAMPSLWTRSYFVSTAGNVSSETIKWYVDTQKTRP